MESAAEITHRQVQRLFDGELLPSPPKIPASSASAHRKPLFPGKSLAEINWVLRISPSWVKRSRPPSKLEFSRGNRQSRPSPREQKFNPRPPARLSSPPTLTGSPCRARGAAVAWPVCDGQAPPNSKDRDLPAFYHDPAMLLPIWATRHESLRQLLTPAHQNAPPHSGGNRRRAQAVETGPGQRTGSDPLSPCASVPLPVRLPGGVSAARDLHGAHAARPPCPRRGVGRSLTFVPAAPRD